MSGKTLKLHHFIDDIIFHLRQYFLSRFPVWEQLDSFLIVINDTIINIFVRQYLFTLQIICLFS